MSKPVIGHLVNLSLSKTTPYFSGDALVKDYALALRLYGPSQVSIKFGQLDAETGYQLLSLEAATYGFEVNRADYILLANLFGVGSPATFNAVQSPFDRPMGSPPWKTLP